MVILWLLVLKNELVRERGCHEWWRFCYMRLIHGLWFLVIHSIAAFKVLFGACASSGICCPYISAFVRTVRFLFLKFHLFLLQLSIMLILLWFAYALERFTGVGCAMSSSVAIVCEFQQKICGKVAQKTEYRLHFPSLVPLVMHLPIFLTSPESYRRIFIFPYYSSFPYWSYKKMGWNSPRVVPLIQVKVVLIPSFCHFRDSRQKRCEEVVEVIR